MKRKALWISIIGILLIGFVCLFCYRHYIRQKQIEQKKHTGLVSEDFPVQDIKHQSKNIYEDAYQAEADTQLQNHEGQSFLHNRRSTSLSGIHMGQIPVPSIITAYPNRIVMSSVK